MQYYSITKYNGSDQIDEDLRFQSNASTMQILNNQDYSICITKFFIDNSLIPCFIPKLDYNPSWKTDDQILNGCNYVNIDKSFNSTSMHIGFSYQDSNVVCATRIAIDFQPQNKIGRAHV